MCQSLIHARRRAFPASGVDLHTTWGKGVDIRLHDTAVLCVCKGERVWHVK